MGFNQAQIIKNLNQRFIFYSKADNLQYLFSVDRENHENLYPV